MKRIALFTLGVILCGCDGHVRSFKAPPAAARTGANAVAGRQKLIDAITAVATQRGYSRSEPKLEADSDTLVWFSKPVKHGSVQMKLMRDIKTDACRVVLIDWPSFVRSRESVAAEAAIRERLNAQ